jgi:cytidylate kinase
MKALKIAVSGKSGCGNTTVSKLAAESLGYRFINFTFRSLAAERRLTLEEVMVLAGQDDFWDLEVDRRQINLAEAGPGGCVLGSRLAIWMLKQADLRVYLRASALTRAGRILKREGGNLEEVAAFTTERDRQDRERYLRLYHIDNDDYSFADLIIDTDELRPEVITALIVEKAGSLIS